MNKKQRKAIIAGNWKMNMLPKDVKPFIDGLRDNIPGNKSCEIVICAPYPLLPALSRAVKDYRIGVGAQNVSEHGSGAYTGEVSLAMLTELSVKYVIVGHSERRQYFGETDLLVREKTRLLLDGGVTPIICVGESLEQRELELTNEHITYQVRAALAGLSPGQARKCVVAYEPVWAIGTGKTATAEQAQQVCREIRSVIRRHFGVRASRGVSILYGGSMNAGNALELLAMEDIDGGLIGGASLHPADLVQIIAATERETDI